MGYILPQDIGRATPNQTESYQVLLYEKLNKKSQQRALIDIQDFTITSQAFKKYRFVYQHFVKNTIFRKEESFVNQGVGFILIN